MSENILGFLRPLWKYPVVESDIPSVSLNYMGTCRSAAKQNKAVLLWIKVLKSENWQNNKQNKWVSFLNVFSLNFYKDFLRAIAAKLLRGHRPPVPPAPQSLTHWTLRLRANGRNNSQHCCANWTPDWTGLDFFFRGVIFWWVGGGCIIFSSL